MVTIRLMPYLCAGSNEVANVARVVRYGECEFFDTPCPCPALDQDTYVSPALDPAPWYDANFPESADFLGFLPQSMILSPPGTRSVTPAGDEGTYVGPQRLRGRVLEVTGWMVARDVQAMWWGQRWLTEVLRGNRCEGCAGDTLSVLPFCRESDSDSEDYAEDFRLLVGAGLVDGPRWAEVSDDPAYIIVEAQFQFVATMPWLYHPGVRCLDGAELGSASPVNCAVTTPEWTQDATFVIALENTGTTEATDIRIEGTISLDGSCPIDPPGDSVYPSFVYTVPSLAPKDVLTIDGMRRKATLRDASAKADQSALPYITWDGAFPWPDVGPCTTMCLSITAESGDVEATVDSHAREL